MSEHLSLSLQVNLCIDVEHDCKSIAFPSISTGAYCYPVERASLVALNAIHEFVASNPGRLELIEIATFSTEIFEPINALISRRLLSRNKLDERSWRVVAMEKQTIS